MPWLPPAVTAALSSAVVAARHGHEAAFPIQVVSILLASGIGFTFDDAAFEVIAPSPTTLFRRRVHRLLLVLPPVAMLWSALLAWQGTAGLDETLALVTLFAGLLGLSIGIAGVAARLSSRGHGGIVVAPVLFIAVLLSTTMPPRWRPLPLGDIPGGWVQIHLRWTAAAIVGVLIFLASSRDLARRRSDGLGAVLRTVRAGRGPTVR